MRKHLLLLIIVCLCLLISGCGEKTTDPLVWEELYLGNIIPMTNLEKSELGLNYPDSLTITVKNCTKADFDSYLSACEEKGFNVDSRRDGIWHYVYNQKGYRLELCLYSTGDMYMADIWSWGTNPDSCNKSWCYLLEQRRFILCEDCKHIHRVIFRIR